jgi:hypothetical protein
MRLVDARPWNRPASREGHSTAPSKSDAEPGALLPAGIAALDELRTIDRWVAWDYRDVKGKRTKIPINPRTGGNAATNAPDTWASYADAERRAIEQNLAGVGIVLSGGNLIGIDLDKCIGESGDIEPWATEVLALGETYAETSPSGRGIRLFARGSLDKAIAHAPSQVEIYSAGRYLTVTGKHIDGTPEEIRDAPRTLAALTARVEGAKTSARPLQTATPIVPDDGGPNWRALNDAALADLSWVRSIFPGATFQPGTGAWRVSSQELGRTLEEDLSIAPNGIVDFGVADMGDPRGGKRSPIDVVMEHGGAATAHQAAKWLSAQLGRSPSYFGLEAAQSDASRRLGQASAEALARGPQAPEHARTDQAALAAPVGFPFVLYRDIDPAPRKAWLIEDVLGAGEFSVWYGAPGSGKSVLIGDAACHVAIGAPWFGRRVQQGAVLYIAAERAKLVERRLAAFRKHHGVNDAPLAVVAGVFDLVGSQADTRKLIVTATEVAAKFGVPLAWLIIDTTAQVMGGADENSSKDMSALVANLSRLQAGTGAHVSAVHHVPVFSPDRMRGHGSLLGALDTSILIEKNGDQRAAILKKVNDGPDDVAFGFELEGVTLAVDHETQKATSAPIVLPLQRAPEAREQGARRDRLPVGQQIALNALKDAISDGGERVTGHDHVPNNVLIVSEEQWRAYAYERRISPTDTPDARKKAFARSSAALIAAGRVASWGGRVWLTASTDNASVSAAALANQGRRT